MSDKEWLDKIETAYKAYPFPKYDIEQFILWLYKQYGIVPPTQKDKQ